MSLAPPAQTFSQILERTCPALPSSVSKAVKLRRKFAIYLTFHADCKYTHTHTHSRTHIHLHFLLYLHFSCTAKPSKVCKFHYARSTVRLKGILAQTNTRTHSAAYSIYISYLSAAVSLSDLNKTKLWQINCGSLDTKCQSKLTELENFE